VRAKIYEHFSWSPGWDRQARRLKEVMTVDYHLIKGWSRGNSLFSAQKKESGS
jgi:hypothetical protein